jgi:hypothetical protein
VLGNACKILSVLINVLIWDKHASPIGLLYLALTLGWGPPPRGVWRCGAPRGRAVWRMRA